MQKSSKIYVAGHNGMVGSAIVRCLEAYGYVNILTKSSKELDLTQQDAVHRFFEKERPEYVFLAAAKAGGIHANNTYRAEFIYLNLAIQTHVIHAAHLYSVKKLLFLGSSCIYPKMCPQPMKEEYMLTGTLEETNEPYAIAKIAGLKMCEAYRSQYGCNFISVMPTNLYGPNDNFDLQKSHVLPALIRKFHEAKINGDAEVEVWGTGNPRREFLHVDDLASACVYLMQNYDQMQFVNIGTGEDISIKELAEMVKREIEFEGNIKYNTSKPDGTLLKKLDVSKLHDLGWKHTISLEVGIGRTYKEYLTAIEDHTLKIA
ncbi:MAG: GDP-L-fucose synthase [Cytophagales bacterium]|nr:GDP-L-fucose synthase [Cytophagales bacterium]